MNTAKFHNKHDTWDYSSSFEKVKNVIDWDKLSGIKILDLGCSDGRVLVDIAQNIKGQVELFGLDSNKKALEQAKKNGINAIDYNFDGHRLPFEDKSFDVILILDTIEHLYGVEEVIGEIHRVLKSNGQVIISFPNAFAIRNRLEILFGQGIIHWAHRQYKSQEVWNYPHIRFPRIVDMKKLLNKMGFQIDKIQYNYNSGGVVPKRLLPGGIRIGLLKLWPNLFSGKFVVAASPIHNNESTKFVYLPDTPEGL